MKRFLIVSAVVVILAMVGNVFACPPEPVVILAASGSAGWGGFCWPILIMEAAVLAAFSPWLIMYHNASEECRSKTSMGEMAECVQSENVKGGK